MQQNWDQGPEYPTSVEASPRRGPLDWWYRLSAPPQPPAGAPLALRERARRGRLASNILLGYMVLLLAALPIGLSDPGTLIGVLTSLGVGVVSIVLNRRGLVYVAGVLVAIITDIALMVSILDSPGGKLDLIYTPLYDLLILSELFAVSLLPPVSVFIAATINSLIVLADVRFQPATAAFAKLLGTPDGYVVVIRPILLQFIVAVVTFLWVRSADRALARADRAEEIAALQQREVERTRELEEGVQQLLAVHVYLANGDFRARVPQVRNPLLWQIGSSLNNLIGRLARYAQADFYLQREQQEAPRVAQAIRMLRAGRQPILPAPSGIPMDEVIIALRGPDNPQALLDQTRVDRPAIPGAQGWPPRAIPPGPVSGPPQTMSDPSTAGLPEWLVRAQEQQNSGPFAPPQANPGNPADDWGWLPRDPRSQ